MGDTHRRLPTSPSPHVSSFAPPSATQPSIAAPSRFVASQPLRRWSSFVPTPSKALLFLAQLLLLAGALFYLGISSSRRSAGLSSTTSSLTEAHRARATRLVDVLFEDQSATLLQAETRYALKTGRIPPQGYSQWFAWCRKRGLLIDSYDQIFQDVKPYYDLHSPSQIKRAINKGVLASDDDELRLVSFSSTQRDGGLQLRSRGTHDFIAFWSDVLKQFNKDLPDFDVVLNWEDNSRVVFDVSDPANAARVYDLDDDEAFKQWPHPAGRFFKDEKRCLLRNSDQGLGRQINDISGFLVSPIQAGFTTNLIPLLTQNSIKPCFADIIVPSFYHMSKTYGWGPVASIKSPDTIPWEEKTEKLYWRGQRSGGFIDGLNWRDFPRFRFVKLGYERPDLIDASFTWSYELCTTYDQICNMIEEEFPITGKHTWQYGYKFKYVFDIDGHAWSGRFLGLMRSNSLVFKSTIWTEYFSHWLLPFVHYIPVLPDLSDLYEKIEWAKAHDDEARRIQAAGAEAVRRIMTDEQATAYFALVFMHIAELQHGWTWANGTSVVDVRA